MKQFSCLLLLLFLSAGAFAQPVIEPPGPSSRRTPITFSEIMYKPAKHADGRNLEFIELYNSNPWAEDISRYSLKGQVQFTFPASTSIPGQGYLVVAAAPADMAAVYGLANVFGPYTNSLKTSGSVTLYDEQGSLLLDVNYDNITPWPMGADGTGHSIVLMRPSYGEGDPRAWERSELAGGSPGAAEVLQTNSLRNVVINEILAHTDPPQTDSIELYNHSTFDVDLSGCTLSDDPVTNKFTIPPGTSIPASGFVYFTETELGFGLNAAGETIYFKNTNATQVLDALKFGAQENGVSFGRYPDGGVEWSRLGVPTFGANNAAPLVSPVGFNEIMYHPLVGGDDAQYVELFNHGTNAIGLGGWKLGGGISWTFASNQVLVAGGYLVVGRNTSYLLANYAQLNAANTAGNFSGKLSGAGERLTLTMPDTILSTNGSGVATTNYLDIVVDEVTYGTGGRWGCWSDGGGSSLELIDARADKRRASSWADSDDTAKSSWANIEFTGTLDNGALNGGSISFAQLGLLDAGECLVDNVEVRPGTAGNNYVSNPNFDSGVTNWTLLGDHSRSSLETNWGYPSGGPCLHLRTADSLEVGPNGTQVALTNTTLASGATATLRFKARWLRGCPEPLLRLRGNFLEAAGRMPVPVNLGTPGLPNSRAATNAGPAIYQVTHSPAVPAANQPVVVTARVSDPDGVASLMLRYRNDPSASLINVTMNDAGINGDAIAGDGIFSATIPGRPAKSAVAFTLLATDQFGAAATFPEMVPDNAPSRECVVVFGDPTPTNIFGTYHLWLTQSNVSRWITLPVMSNEDIDGTLVYNNRVIYNMGGRYSGSPWHQYYDSPAGSRACHYVWSMPKDDLLLGTSSFNKIHWPGNDIQYDSSTSNVNDPTLQREQAANTFLRGLGTPWIYRRFVAVYVNGVRRGNLMEDSFRPNASSVKDEYFPNDTDGQYYKLQPWYEFDTATYLNFANESWCMIQKYTTTGGAWKPARYRSNWGLISSPGSMSDFTNVYALVTATTATGQTNYPDLVENVADMENWMRVSAANHAAGNWDCFGSTGSGQNVYAWISPQHGWTLFTIDFSICLGNSIANSPGGSMFSFYDPVWQQIYAKPIFKRMYYRALKELVNGPMLATKINPIMNAKYAAFQAAGLNVTSPSSTESWIASAQSSVAAQVAAADVAGFTLATNFYNSASNAVTLTGSAPFQVTTIWINGEAFTLTWLTQTSWSIVLPVAFGTNSFTVSAFDRFGNKVGTNTTVTVANPTQPESPVGNVVFNEIMYNPAVSGGEFVELFNRATNTTFDLSGWTVNGLGYNFPSGSVLAPRKYLVLAKSRTVFAASYGGLVSVFDEFTGGLQMDGETLSLIQPGTNGDVVIDRVRYEPNAPWPTEPVRMTGVSLQLVDASQDDSRVANWSASMPTNFTLITYTNVWKYMQVSNLDGVNWTAASFNDSDWPSGLGLLAYENNPAITSLIYTTLNDPTIATNSMTAGHAYYFRLSFPLTKSLTNYTINATAYIDDGMVLYINGSEITRIRMNSGTVLNSTLANALAPDADGDATIPDTFTILASAFAVGTNVIAVSIHQQRTSSSDIVFGLKLEATSSGPAGAVVSYPTPGTANSVAATLPEFPPLWLNEVEAENLTGPADNFGEHDPWVELFNAGTNTISLNGFYLGTNYNSATNWAFPAGTSIAPGQFLVVWLDGQPAQSNGASLHTSFRLDSTGGKLALARFVNGAQQIVDYLNYLPLPANDSYGDFPDGQPFYRKIMFYTTPGGTNNALASPISVSINEWMAENTGYLLNPGTGKYDDWFELFNPSSTPADLTGYYLTDALNNRFQFQIPAGFIVPTNGFLLVWADNKTSANTNSPNLHVPFKLDKSGEAIGLFAPDGTAIDAVVFGAQTSNVSEGRYPDGGDLRLFMPTPSPMLPNVLPPASNVPTVTACSLQANQSLNLTFQTSPGHTYRVEYKNDLSDSIWLPLGADHFATGSTETINDNSSNLQRFYRVNMVQ
jgi:hypothetical protein